MTFSRVDLDRLFRFGVVKLPNFCWVGSLRWPGPNRGLIRAAWAFALALMLMGNGGANDKEIGVPFDAPAAEKAEIVRMLLSDRSPGSVGEGDDRVYGDVFVSMSELYNDRGQAIASGKKGDLLDGGNGADVLVGDRGNDVIAGGAGSDIIFGGAGDDVLLASVSVTIASAGWTIRRKETELGGNGRDPRGFTFSGMTFLEDAIVDPFATGNLVHRSVSKVFRDAIADRERGLVYTAQIALRDDAIPVNGHSFWFSPGMIVSAELRTGERRIIEYLISPLVKYRDESARER